MKTLLVLALLVCLAAPTYAQNSNISGLSGFVPNMFSGLSLQGNRGWWSNWRSNWRSRWNNNRRGGNRGGGQNNSRAVPELDGAIAPLAGVLIAGLLAAGAERRRRRKK